MNTSRYGQRRQVCPLHETADLAPLGRVSQNMLEAHKHNGLRAKQEVLGIAGLVSSPSRATVSGGGTGPLIVSSGSAAVCQNILRPTERRLGKVAPLVIAERSQQVDWSRHVGSWD